MTDEIKKLSRAEQGLINITPYMWKRGQSGNPAGRPKGKTMKEWAREVLACQTEEERQAFLHGIPKSDIWKMAEGLPQQDITSGGEKINPIPILKLNLCQEESILEPKKPEEISANPKKDVLLGIKEAEENK